MLFNSQITELADFYCNYTNDEIKNEPMFFNCSADFAYSWGGNITRSFLRSFEKLNIPIDSVFDSRVHMLMPGWYPCIPGWHHDDVARGSNGQPDYINLRYKSKHVCGLVNAEICPTAFAIGECNLEIPEGIIYKQWHNEVDKLIECGKMNRVEAKSGKVIYFDWQTFHTGQKAVKNGWRWFGRLSWDTERTKNITNEIRKQVNVYLEFPTEGW